MRAPLSGIDSGGPTAFLEGRRGAGHSGPDREVGIERLADLHHLLAGETAAGGKLGDRFEVMVLPTRQAPAQHASRDAADVLEAVHDVARDEDDAAGTPALAVSSPTVTS